MRIGVLALQGDFSKHVEVLRSLGVEVVEVRKPWDLSVCDGLIIPGGESTVMMRLLDFIGLYQPLIEFSSRKPVFGTCAGLILMSKKVQDSSVKPLQLIDIVIERNAFGRQIESFQAFINLELTAQHTKVFPAFFIRAPRIREQGAGVKVLGVYGQEPVLVRQGHHLGASFHPELTDDPLVHRYFIKMVDDSYTP